MSDSPVEPERVAVFSDIHGNAVALDAVLTDLGRLEVERSICLGDAVQGGPEPLRVVELLRELGCPVIMGNADSYVLTGLSAEPTTDKSEEIRRWTLEALGEEGRRFVQTFDASLEIDLGEGRRLLCFHGSPNSFNTVLLPESTDEEFADGIGDVDADWYTGGHTHIQFTRPAGPGRFFNPGSVGAVYNRYMGIEEFYFYPVAQYAILHVSPRDIALEFRQVPVDADTLEKVTLESGHPYRESEAARYRPPN